MFNNVWEQPAPPVPNEVKLMPECISKFLGSLRSMCPSPFLPSSPDPIENLQNAVNSQPLSEKPFEWCISTALHAGTMHFY